ncbi:hypothetical protein BDW66DRAFT_168658 [Aspergillus desertorum]
MTKSLPYSMADSAKLQEWFESLPCCTLDLVGDYAGDELFFLEGDSLFLQCFSDDALDFSNGLQLLHAVSLVEKLLSSLHQRKCMFHIVFFKEHAQACIPTEVGKEQWPKYLLAREAILQHLAQNLATAVPAIQLKCFTSYRSTEFQRYLQSAGAYFLMCHDGAAPGIAAEQLGTCSGSDGDGDKIDFSNMDRSIPSASSEAWTTKGIMRFMVHWFMCRGYNISLLNSLEFRDSKCPGLDRSMKANDMSGTSLTDTDSQNSKSNTDSTSLHPLDFFERHQIFETSKEESLELTQREWATVLTVGSMLQSSSLETDTLKARAILLHVAILGACKLSERTRIFHQCVASEALLLEYCNTLRGILSSELWKDVITKVPCSCDLADALDGWLFLETARALREAQGIHTFGPAALKKFEALASVLRFLFYTDHEGCSPNSTRKKNCCEQTNSKSSLSVLSFQNSVIDAHLEPVSVMTSDTTTDIPSGSMSRIFRELTKIALTEHQKMVFNRRNQRLTNAVGRSLMPEVVFVKDKKAKQPKQVQGPRLNQSPQKKNGKSAKVSVRDRIAAQQNAKQVEQYVKVKQHLSNMPAEKRSVLQAEVLTYMLSTLIVALIWQTIQQIANLKQRVTEDIVGHIRNTVQTMNLPYIDVQVQETRKLSFCFVQFDVTKGDVGVALSPTEFQLVHAGPYLDRSMGSAPDPGVHDSEPDKWQREVLDQIDARRSLFVVAPTSAGKTFISFYAIKQVLEDDDDGVLVYVAPTKALVNQIAAEVQARFSKAYNKPGKSVWAIHTRDCRINNPTGCQVLITVPHILADHASCTIECRIMVSSCERIIFDEVHCIGQAEDSVIWEQLLLLAPCPIIALSATIGNPTKFKEWLGMTQEANGLELKMIEHKARYSDLRKYIYHPPTKFVFDGLPKSPQLALLDLDGSSNMAFVHPVVSLIDRSRGLREDLTLEPRDCLMLWRSMKKHSTSAYPVDRLLDPHIALPSIVRKADVIKWEAKLKGLLRQWMDDSASPFGEVVKELSHSVENHNSPTVQVSSSALPALFFNYDRNHCEKICNHLLAQLEESEARWKASSSVWKKKIARYQEWERLQEKHDRVREPGKIKRSKNHDDDGEGEETLPEVELARSVASAKDSSLFETFDPDAPISGFCFADEMKLTDSEFKEYATQLRHRHVAERLITALRRGIGVHHSGLNRKYRQVCEILFRKGYLCVVIATGTLALGINMPCKTVVFSGDSVFLTALGFRQAAGRAGRLCRLLSSKLPDLNGHFPLTTTLVLRLLTLLHESKGSPYAVKAINSILSCPRIYLGGEQSKHTVLHHLRFSIERSVEFSGAVSHLYYAGNSSFAFHALLIEGYFHRLCTDVWREPKETLRTLMLVLSHLFGRYHLRPSVLESLELGGKCASVVILPPVPKTAAKIINSHNQKTLSIYSAEDDCTLPSTGVRFGGTEPAKDLSTSLKFLPPTRVTSTFAALSGHRDGLWQSISELCNRVRSGVWLEQSVIPYLQVSPEKGQAPLNAYLYDFYKHGNVHALVTENMIRRGDLCLENFMKLSPGLDPDLIETIGSGDALDDDLDHRMFEESESGAQMSLNILLQSQLAAKARTTASSKKRPKRTKVADTWEENQSEDSGADSDRLGHLSEDSWKLQQSDRPANGQGSNDAGAFLEGEGLLQVLRAFRMLQEKFNTKFRAIWA